MVGGHGVCRKGVGVGVAILGRLCINFVWYILQIDSTGRRG